MRNEAAAERQINPPADGPFARGAAQRGNQIDMNTVIRNFTRDAAVDHIDDAADGR